MMKIIMIIINNENNDRKRANKKIKNAFGYCSINKLSLYADKTKYIFFRSKEIKKICKIKINNISLTRVN